MRLLNQEIDLKHVPLRLSTLVLTSWLGLAPALAGEPPAAVPYVSAFESSTSAAPAPLRWQQANADVARNPRGHMDILRWESQQAAAPQPADGMAPGAPRPLTPQQALGMALHTQPELIGRARSNALAQLTATTRVRQLALDVQRAWVEAVAAQQALGLQAQAHELALQGLTLGQRMVQAGNWSQVPLLQQQASASGAALQWAQAQQQAFTRKEQLIRLLGVMDPASVALPERLPALPAAPLVIPDVQAQAVAHNMALTQASIEAQRASAALAAPEAPRWQAAAQVAIDRVTDPDAAGDAGPALGRLPSTAPQIDTTRTVLSHEAAEVAQAQAHARALEASTRSLAREAYFRYRTALDVARHRTQEGVRIATAQQEETQLRYNGMIQNTWDLLASTRARLQSLDAAAQAQRDFWLAHLDLQAVLAGLSVNFSNPSATGNADAAPQGH